MRARLFPLLSALTLCFSFANAQQAPAPSIGTPPPPSTLVDIRLTGSATWQVGPDSDSGNVTLEATRSGKSRMDLQLSSGQRSEVRVNDTVSPHLFLFTSSTWTESAVHNSWVDANWFFPLFSTAAVASERGFVVSTTGSSAVRTQLSTTGLNSKSSALIQSLSTVNFDLDPTTQLPTHMRWSTHPDDNFLVNIREGVRYSDYRSVNGIQVPYRIQRYLNGLLQLDITVTNVVINPGVSDSDFSPMAN